MKTFLRPARHIQSGHSGSREPIKDTSGGLVMILQLLALAAGIYLWRFSDLAYVVGLKSRENYKRD
ncbi:MAG: hypothetical protein COB53_11105 [Elusimicrobia bacterium]|nr:MAG: hypothetical protein COB53_11105 [Elusimicrobiota bacterium]